MPYSEGWHPYFILGEKIDDLVMTLPPTKRSELDQADIPTGNLLDDTRFTSGRKIGADFINDCFCLEAPIPPCARAVLEGSIGTLDIWQNAGDGQYNAIQIYTPPTRDSIAIEPMTAEPDALNHHRGLIVVAPGERRTFRFGATFKNK